MKTQMLFRSENPAYAYRCVRRALAYLVIMAIFGILPTTVFSPQLRAAAAVAWADEAYGYAFNVKTIEEAESLARAAAVKNGGDPEKIEILATSKVVGYGAIAVDGNIIGVTIGYPDLRAAIVRSKQECIKRGGRFPRVVATWHDRGY